MTVPPTTGPARVGRGGGRGRGDLHHQAAGAADDEHPNLSRVINAYQPYKGEMGQVIGILRNIEQLQAGQNQWLDTFNQKIDDMTGVLRDIGTSLRQIANYLTTPPCVPTTSSASTSAQGTGRDVESGREYTVPQERAAEGPPPNVGRVIRGRIPESQMTMYHPRK